MIDQMTANSLTEQNYHEKMQKLSSSILLFLDEDIKESIQLGFYSINYFVYFNKRSKYRGTLLSLLHLNRDNNIKYLIKYLKNLGYIVKIEEITKYNYIFSDKAIGFKLSICWDSEGK